MTVHPSTAAVHAGRDDLTTLGVHALPLDLSTTYPIPDLDLGVEAYEAMAHGAPPSGGGGLVYQRLWNPTVARFENALAELEHAEAAVAFGSGMAAFAACLLAATAGGERHVVGVRPLYGGSEHLLNTGLLGTTVTWTAPDSVGDAVRPDTALVVVETPANPDLRLLDLARLRQQIGATPLLVDNTFATSVLQQPLRHGADLVLHSATKFIGGHGDVMAGVVAAGDEWARRLRSVRAITGALLYPFAAYLLHRGLQTLPVRVFAAQRTAALLAQRLSTYPGVVAVRYPGLPGQDPHGVLGRQMAGPGAVLSFEVADAATAAGVAARCRVVTHAVSLGGVDILISHPASLTHRFVAADAKPRPGLLRLSVGLEDIEDLWADLVGAIDGRNAADGSDSGHGHHGGGVA